MERAALDRRRFLQISGGVLSLPLLTRCAEPAKGSVIVSSIAIDPPSMNPAISNDPNGMQASAPVYSWLIALDRNGHGSPDLATSWDVSDDVRVFTFHLRKGVLWHDGKPFSAADVKFTIQEVISRMHPTARQVYKTLRSVEAPDDHTVVVTFERPNNSYLASRQCFGPILPRS